MLKNLVNKKGNLKTTPLTTELKKQIDSLTLTTENSQYAQPHFDKNTLVKYEPAQLDRSEGIRVINYCTVSSKYIHRIYR